MTCLSVEQLNPYIVSVGGLTESNCPSAGTVFERRRVRWYEIELIYRGEGRIITDGVELPTEDGSLFFRKPGMIVQGITPYICDLVVFDPRYDDAHRSVYDASDPLSVAEEEAGPEAASFPLDLPPRFFPRNAKCLADSMAHLRSEYILNGRRNQLVLKTILYDILRVLAEEIEESGGRGLSPEPDSHVPHERIYAFHEDKIGTVAEYIKANPGGHFTLAELAAKTGLSPNFFCRVFRDIQGEPLFTFINRIKVNEAKRLLAETRLSVKEIAAALGFDNENYFYTLFHRREGISPRIYRKRHRY
jgi:AraC-like DNA-binding protein